MMMDQDRVSYLQFHNYPRCTAISKSTGERCKRIAKQGFDVCGIHAGLYSPGAPKGNSNARKHGLYTKETQREHCALQEMANTFYETLKEIQNDQHL